MKEITMKKKKKESFKISHLKFFMFQVMKLSFSLSLSHIYSILYLNLLKNEKIKTDSHYILTFIYSFIH